jgi:hypothetical protein
VLVVVIVIIPVELPAPSRSSSPPPASPPSLLPSALSSHHPSRQLLVTCRCCLLSSCLVAAAPVSSPSSLPLVLSSPPPPVSSPPLPPLISSPFLSRHHRRHLSSRHHCCRLSRHPRMTLTTTPLQVHPISRSNPHTPTQHPSSTTTTSTRNTSHDSEESVWSLSYTSRSFSHTHPPSTAHSVDSSVTVPQDSVPPLPSYRTHSSSDSDEIPYSESSPPLPFHGLLKSSMHQLSLTLHRSQTHTLFVPTSTPVQFGSADTLLRVLPSLQLVLPLRSPVPGALSLPVTMVIMYTPRLMMTIKPSALASPRMTSISRTRIRPCPPPCLNREHQ